MRWRRAVIVALVVAVPALVAQERLDTTSMRNDFFAAIAGNRDAITRFLEKSKGLLQRHPDHPQALVWHGAGLLATGQPNPKSTPEEREAAIARFQSGVAEMDRAVGLAPDDIEVRVVRGVIFRPISQQMPPPFSERMLEKARSDFQRIFDLQQNELDGLGTHPLGELLQNLGDAYSRQGKPDEAEKYYRLIEARLEKTEYARRATVWLRTRQPLPLAETMCVGCHVH
jgi:tetratricopeptide (TPR) repeat protein